MRWSKNAFQKLKAKGFDWWKAMVYFQQKNLNMVPILNMHGVFYKGRSWGFQYSAILVFTNQSRILIEKKYKIQNIFFIKFWHFSHFTFSWGCYLKRGFLVLKGKFYCYLFIFIFLINFCLSCYAQK